MRTRSFGKALRKELFEWTETESHFFENPTKNSAKQKGYWDSSETWKNTLALLPELKVSDDGKMAVEHTEDFTRQFFATPETVRESNLMLQKIASPLKLEVSDKPALRLSENGQNLHAITPDLSQTEYASDCQEMAEKVMGHAQELAWTALFRAENTYRQVPTFFEMDFLLCTHISLRKGKSPEGLYAQAKNLGVNEFASPNVGEAFSIQSPYWAKHEKPMKIWEYYANLRKDYDDYLPVPEETTPSEMLKKQSHIEWNLHFGTVVAKSGNDCISLESVNMTTGATKEYLAAFDRLMLRYDSFIAIVRQFYSQHPAYSHFFPLSSYEKEKRINEIFRFAEAVIEKGSKLQERLLRLEDEYAQSMKTLKKKIPVFSFRMYGAEKGQTFHDIWHPQLPEGSMTFHVKKSLEVYWVKIIEIFDRKINFLSRAFHITHSSKTEKWSKRLLEDLNAEKKRLEENAQRISAEVNSWPMTAETLKRVIPEQQSFIMERLQCYEQELHEGSKSQTSASAQIQEQEKETADFLAWKKMVSNLTKPAAGAAASSI